MSQSAKCFQDSIRFAALAAMLALGLGMSSPVRAENYSPLFSPDFLTSLDAETRERFAALEAENYQRWRNRNPQAPDIEASKRQHAETEAMLRRIQESRALAAEAKRRKAPGSQLTAKQKRNCELVAAEIKEMKSGGAFFEIAEDGARHYLSDEQISKRVKTQQKSYNRHCRS